MIDTQEEVSLAEFKAWLAGLIRGKRGALPDLEDWKAIKNTLDKVVPDTVEPLGGPAWTPPVIVKEIFREMPVPEPVPYINPYQPIWITTPDTGDWFPNPSEVWCSGVSNVGGGTVQGAGAGDALQGGAGYMPQGQAMCGGMTIATAADNSNEQLDDAISMMFASQET